ncbi:hypothetical protein GCM10009716_34080 [Streptomyces sodiiphilus]|uniref:Gram-positive cocci surface proteins LPxTG domain-containing protein n=1 Tax=Streptomyces sodiiphilus TaxID=226217 RepID=A0ABN2PII3_9ACTN
MTVSRGSAMAVLIVAALLVPAGSAVAEPEAAPGPRGSLGAPAMLPDGGDDLPDGRRADGRPGGRADGPAAASDPAERFRPGGPAGEEGSEESAPGPVARDEGLLPPGSREVLPVLPLGTGLVFLGLGIAAFGLRLRRP